MPYRAKYVGDSLRGLVTEATYSATDRLRRDIASEAADILHTSAKAATPSRTGAVRNSWYTPELRHEFGAIIASARTDHWLSPLLAYGTQPHEIKPKRKRALTEAAGPRGSAHVAGIQPHFMAERAVETVRATIDDRTVAMRERWAREVEANIELMKRRLR